MRKLLTSLLLIKLLFLFSAFNDLKAEKLIKTAYDFSFNSIEGDSFNLSAYRNKVMLVVNTASFCAFTPQYMELQKIWDEYKGKGLVVIGVPSRDFGKQEYDDDKNIKKFCAVNFDINFPMTTLSKVSGHDAHPFYRWANNQVGFAGKPRWNFHKFLVAPDGKIVDWFSSVTEPSSEKMKKAIEIQLSLIRP